MAKMVQITEHFQDFLAEMKESFWGDLYGQTQLAWQRFFELQSERQRDRFSGWTLLQEESRNDAGNRPHGYHSPLALISRRNTEIQLIRRE